MSIIREKKNNVFANLKCPHCGNIMKVKIPKDRCLIYFKCSKCHKLIMSFDKCCVICSYSDKKCPVSKRK